MKESENKQVILYVSEGSYRKGLYRREYAESINHIDKKKVELILYSPFNGDGKGGTKVYTKEELMNGEVK